MISVGNNKIDGISVSAENIDLDTTDILKEIS